MILLVIVLALMRMSGQMSRQEEKEAHSHAEDA